MEFGTVCAVIPAAGTGERTGLNIPKQFYSILNKPLICHTVEEFLRVPWITKIIVVSSAKNFSLMKKSLSILKSGNRIVIGEGSDTRHKSIKAGIKLLEDIENIPDIVVIHDGVRLFVPLDILTEIVDAASKHGAAGIVQPLVSTVVARDQNGFMEHALDRNKYWASEMPQAFQYSVIHNAYEKCSVHDLNTGTECLLLAEKYSGIKAKLIQSSTHLWKVTYRKDFYSAEESLKENRKVAVFINKEDLDFMKILEESLKEKYFKVNFLHEDLVHLPSQDCIRIFTSKSLSCVIHSEDSISNFSYKKYAVVNVILNGCTDDSFNLVEIAKQNSLEAMNKNIFLYYICSVYKETSDHYQKIGKLAAALLFDCNDLFCGHIFFI